MGWDAPWYETAAFFGGLAFGLAEWLTRIVRGWKPAFNMMIPLMFGEGTSVTLMIILIPALFLDHNLATQITAKNGKLLAIGLALATYAILRHVLDRWVGGEQVH